MAAPVSKPRISVTNPDKKLQVKDVTRQDVLEKVNTYYETSPTLNKASEYMKSDQVSSRGILASITDSLVPTGAGLSIDKDTLRQRLSESMGVGNLVTGLSQSMLGELASAMGAQDGEGLVKSLMNGYNEVSGIIEGLDPKSANSIASAIARLTGQDGLLSFLDIGAELGTISYLTNRLIELGAIDAIDALLAKIKDERDLNAMLEDLALEAARQSDLGMCKHFVDKMGSGRAYNMRDALCTAIVSSYMFAYEDTRSLSERYSELVGLLSQINPGWTRNEKHSQFESLEYFSKASPDAITVMQSDKSLLALAAAGSVTAISTPEEINQASYPQRGTW